MDFEAPGRSVLGRLVGILGSGILVLIPAILTVYILLLVYRFVVSLVEPFREFVEATGVPTWIQGQVMWEFGIYGGDSVALLSDVIVATVLFGTVVVAGLTVRTSLGRQFVETLEGSIQSLPVVGTLYGALRRASEMLADDGEERFQSVKLVEFPGDDIYVIGFETGGSPESVRTVAGEDVVTLFLPLAPNPVTGGFLSYVPQNRVHEVEMSVEEAVRTLVTSGIAADEPDGAFRTLSEDELDRLR